MGDRINMEDQEREVASATSTGTTGSMVAPNGRVEVIDAINRELTFEEVKKLREWRKLPGEFVSDI